MIIVLKYRVLFSITKTTQLLASLDVTVDIDIERRSIRLCDVSNFRFDVEKETSSIKMVLKKQLNISI